MTEATSGICVARDQPTHCGIWPSLPDHAAALLNGSDIGRVSGNQNLLVKFCSTCPGQKRAPQQTQSNVGLVDDPGHVSEIEMNRNRTTWKPFTHELINFLRKSLE